MRKVLAKVRKLINFSAIFSLIALLACIIFIVISNIWILISTKNNIVKNIKKMPPRKACLVLGTAYRLRGGRKNLYFENRMQAAAELYQQGIVNYILVSGDNSIRYYNEPKEMKKALIKRGVPAEDIYQDFAGFRTLDSIVRAKKVFGLEKTIIVSDRFHLPRALFIAKRKNLAAIGYPSQTVKTPWALLRNNSREILARVLAVLDIFANVQPRHLGKKIEIGEND